MSKEHDVLTMYSRGQISYPTCVKKLTACGVQDPKHRVLCCTMCQDPDECEASMAKRWCAKHQQPKVWTQTEETEYYACDKCVAEDPRA